MAPHLHPIARIPTDLPPEKTEPRLIRTLRQLEPATVARLAVELAHSPRLVGSAMLRHERSGNVIRCGFQPGPRGRAVIAWRTA